MVGVVIFRGSGRPLRRFLQSWRPGGAGGGTTFPEESIRAEGVQAWDPVRVDDVSRKPGRRDRVGPERGGRDVHKGPAHLRLAGLLKGLGFNSECDRSHPRVWGRRIIFSSLHFKEMTLLSVTLIQPLTLLWFISFKFCFQSSIAITLLCKL